MAEYFLIVKSLHIISFVAWMVGLLYLPRLFVYHAGAVVGSDLSETLKIMERKLLRFILTPAMIFTFIFGIMLIYIVGPQSLTGWFHVKMLCVLILAFLHGMMAKYRRDFALDINKKSSKFYRIFNEIPTVLLIVIVFLAVLKPF